MHCRYLRPEGSKDCKGGNSQEGQKNYCTDALIRCGVAFASCLLPLASCLLPLASCLLPTPYSLLPILHNQFPSKIKADQ
ncbi:hypothetical protein [Moorena producens]|uniref:hypothetical protein n=1 Tax=Moorena producens TaxID=1155739 RepID=UPI0011EA63A3|nr:hypothetical protein [Moorena producens]